ncbi:LPS-assembly protein LptD [Anianabacter salinae]|uniref:LPS-assembly protein LptD n=1 Tax=Anianabacter salinae TaxID=2851023 RepID=UPI00225E0EB5|nr:LPS assembly protein LptD [Anianabacter salinae]MBV0914048.1 LPS assembly protein LptD [Anianabacter salinae]
MLRRLLWQIAFVVLCAAGAAAQTPATLVADQVALSGDQTITATGNVEVLYEGSRLRAPRIVYDQEADRIVIDGPLTIVQPDGTVLTGEQADLDADLLNGIVLGARIVLDEQMQIAGAEAFRVNGRYNQLGNAVASTCRVCGDGPPLWQIRARRVVHDQEEKQIYFYDARFEVGGLPIAYLPRLRMPDPTLKRATGFLTPSYRVSDLFGFGIKVPYFIAIDDHQDLLLTPYLAPETRTLEFRYRRALRNGFVTVQGAVSDDSIRPGQLRYFIKADTTFNLPRDFALAFSINDASDASYGSEYGFPVSTEFASSASLSRTKRASYFNAEANYYETKSNTPTVSYGTSATTRLSLLYDRRFTPLSLGGEGRFQFELAGLNRPLRTITPAITASCTAESVLDCTARDSVQAHAEIDWQKNWFLAGGVVAGFEAGLAGDYVLTRDDPAFGSNLAQAVPTVATSLRWPVSRQTRSGSQLLEPILQVGYAGLLGDRLPNDDSRLNEFDFGNFLKLSRFSGDDRTEEGLQAALGLTWSHYANSGWTLHLAGGRVFRDRTTAGFSNSSGLSGSATDYLVAAGVEYEGWTLQSRLLLDPGLDVTRAEARAGFSMNRLSVSGTYFYSLADLAESRATDVSEIAFSGGISLSQRWSTAFSTRFDLVADRRDDTVIDLTYQNECIRVGLSWTQRYISSTSATQETAYGITIGLNGVGNDARRFRRTCSG